ncbi:response regulator transcription factor [Solibacillus sp. MA9]|uniref:Response regulator transcription factor n=1 Tax=Solibacillus palustris TaxID=2908203 RepID=A0ABS9UCJ6_9BACL|nr:response regulator transcription factor [Solibacillus sp. MA9]MCH7322062.1 response regulator transcription factor [Solibacillus sp. MA9]
MRILVAEDELDLQEAIAEGLRMEGYAVDTCSNGEEAYELAFVENYDLIILDLNLPQLDGLKVLEKIREENKEIKVLILSARSRVNDKVLGLDMGANDYLTKPFDFEELEARIRNLLRRKFVQENSILSCGEINMDLTKRSVFIGEHELLLTKKEFALLEYFLLHQERVLSQEELVAHVWDQNADSFSGVIRVHIATLRKKLKALLKNDPILTKVGVGYFITKNDGDT